MTRPQPVIGRLPVYVAQATLLASALTPFVLLFVCHTISSRAQQLGWGWPNEYEPLYLQRDAVYNFWLHSILDRLASPFLWSVLFVPLYFATLRGLCSRPFRYTVAGVYVAGWAALMFSNLGALFTYVFD